MRKINFKNYGHQKNWISGTYVDSISTKNISVVSPYYNKEIAIISETKLMRLGIPNICNLQTR